MVICEIYVQKYIFSVTTFFDFHILKNTAHTTGLSASVPQYLYYKRKERTNDISRDKALHCHLTNGSRMRHFHSRQNSPLHALVRRKQTSQTKNLRLWAQRHCISRLLAFYSKPVSNSGTLQVA